MMAQKGQGTLLVLIVVGLSGMFAMVWTAMREQQFKVARYMDQKAASEAVGRQFSIAISDGVLCGCSLAAHTFDAGNTTGSAAIQVDRIPTSCDPNSPALVMRAQKLAGGMEISRIELADLRPAGTPPTTAWTGTWRIHFDTAGGTQIRPIEIPQNITTSADAGSVSVAACAAQSSSPRIIESCPTGWAMVGPAGRIGTYCISQNPRGPMTQDRALDDCNAHQPSTGGTSHLCNNTEWYAACTQGVMNNAPTLPEWNTEFFSTNYVTVSGIGGQCRGTSRRIRSEPNLFRCCYP